MPTLEGSTVVVLETNAILRLGVEALLESWGCQVIAGENIEDVIAAIRDRSLYPNVLLLPPVDGQKTGDQLARYFETEVGHSLPWIGITADFNLLQRWRTGRFGGTLLEMPCSPEVLQSTLLAALSKQH